MDLQLYLNDDELPGKFAYPAEFMEFIERGYPEIRPWAVMDREGVLMRIAGLKSRYPDRSALPFAQRLDNDDIACFDVSGENGPCKIHIIHDFASPGWEFRHELDDFRAWLSLVDEDIREWNSPP